MDFYAINGETINGTPVLPIAASAGVTCTIDISAVATRNVLPSAALNSGSASFVADPTFTQAAASTINPQAAIQTDVTFIHAASASLVCSADIVVAVYRVVPCAVQMDCFADLQAIPASTLAHADVTTDITLDASATKIQPGASAMAGTVAVEADPVVTRYVAASIDGTAALRVEATLNNLLDGFVDVALSASFSMPDTGIVFRQAAAYVELQDNLAITPTYIYASSGALIDCYADVEPDGITLAVPAAILVATADFTADGVRIVLPTVSMAVTADVAAPALQRHAADTTAVGSVVLTSTPVVTQWGMTTIDAGSSFAASGTAVRMAVADVQGGADVALAPSNNMVASATIDPSTDISVSSVRICLAAVDGVLTADFIALSTATRPAEASITGGVAVDAVAVNTMPGSALIDSHVDFSLYPVMKIMAACVLGVTVDVRADARVNIEAIDLPDDTMYRPAEDTEFDRPFEETEMRRYA